ncbi:hypothetical protein GEMRC1_003992 [Eukaryota sp. GEM-RC1]
MNLSSTELTSCLQVLKAPGRDFVSTGVEEADYELAMEHSDFEDSKPDDADQSHQTNWELKANMEDLNEEEDYGDPFFVRAPFLLDPLDEFGDDVNNNV